MQRTIIARRFLTTGAIYVVCMALIIIEVIHAASTLNPDGSMPTGPRWPFFVGMLGIFILGFRAASMLHRAVQYVIDFRFYVSMPFVVGMAVFGVVTVPICLVALAIQYAVARRRGF